MDTTNQITLEPAVTEAEVCAFMSKITIPDEYFAKMLPGYREALEAFLKSRTLAQAA